MFEHRFREHLAEQPQQPAAAAFVACPLAAFAPAHASYVAEVYRAARELAEAKLTKPARPRIPAFSLN
jgi:hypothetical protein